jgi:hypothetical protein
LVSIDVLDVACPAVAPRLVELDVAVTGVLDLDTRSWPAAERAAHLTRLRTAIDQLEAAFIATVASCDAAGDAEVLDAAHSTRAWLTDRLRLAPGDAGERVRLARAAHRGHAPLAAATQAMAAGQVSYDAVRAIGRAMGDLEPGPARRGVELLTELARAADVGRVRVAARHLRHVVDPERGKADFDAQFAARRANFAPLLDGMYTLDVLADPEGAAVLDAGLSALMAMAGSDDRRTTAQRRYDALIELVRGQLEHGSVPVVGGVRPRVVVTCSAPALSRQPGALPATLPDGTPLPVETLDRIACDPVVERVVFGPQGEVLDYGRSRRLFTAAQRKALRARDAGCRFPGCGLPWAQAHHVVAWQDGGPTDLANALLLCQVHHHRVHDDGWRIVAADPDRGSNAGVTFISPTGEHRTSSGPRSP